MFPTLLTLLIANALDGYTVPPPSNLVSIDGGPPAGGGSPPPPAPGGAPPPAPGGAPPAPAPGAPPKEPEKPAEPFAVFPTADLFNKRIGQEARKLFKEIGFESEEHAKQVLTERQEAEKKAKEQKRAEMTELERVRGDLTTSQQDLKTLREENEQLKLDIHLGRLFSEKGIKNSDYARFKIAQKLEELPENEELDEAAFLDDLAKDPAQAAALGVSTTPPTPPGNATKPPTTRPNVGAPPPPPAGGPGQPPIDYAKMSQAEFAAFRASRGLR